MCRRRILIVAALVAATVGHAGAAAASPNEMRPPRLGLSRLPVTVQDLAPPECAGLQLEILVTPATGENGAKIRGTPRADLVLGTSGDDRIDGLGGDDCIVGGAGSDELDGGPGNDRCLLDDPGDTATRCEP